MKKIAIALVIFVLLSVCAVFSGAETEIKTMLVNYETGCVRGVGIPTEHTGFIGNILDVGSSDVTVHAIGRMWYDGNCESHVLRIVRASDKKIVAEETLKSGTDGSFSYVELSEPVTLSANTTYYLLSDEDTFGDSFGDGTCGLYCTGDLAINGYVLDEGGIYTEKIAPTCGYLAIDLKYSSSPAEVKTIGEEGVLFSEIIKGDGAIRNNFGSLVGATFYVEKPIYVTELGRVFLDGNNQEHTVLLIDMDTDKVVPGGTAIISGGSADGEVTFARLDAPVLLEGEHCYYLVSREYMDGDMWYEGDARHVPSDPNQFTGLGWTYYITSFTTGSGEYGFVGVNMKYMLADMPDPSVSSETEDTVPAPEQTSEKDAGTSAAPESKEKGGDDGKQEETPFPVLYIVISVVAVAMIAAIIIISVKKKKA
ncbi:MAG: hypothetical protein IKS28_08450 [Clostridia bacterium]|nr:hypothetical protein [Clostridia bacterium]